MGQTAEMHILHTKLDLTSRFSQFLPVTEHGGHIWPSVLKFPAKGLGLPSPEALLYKADILVSLLSLYTLSLPLPLSIHCPMATSLTSSCSSQSCFPRNLPFYTLICLHRLTHWRRITYLVLRLGAREWSSSAATWDLSFPSSFSLPWSTSCSFWVFPARSWLARASTSVPEHRPGLCSREPRVKDF